jgi:signal peptidase I
VDEIEDSEATVDDSTSAMVERLRDKSREDEQRTKAHRSFWRELPVLVLIALVVAVLIKTFLFQAFFIESGSMTETLIEGDRVMVNKLSYRFGDPDPGDVIVFDPPPSEGEVRDENLAQSVLRNIAESVGLSQPSSEFIKRVIAVEGQTFEIRDNVVLIDGEPLEEPYVRAESVMADFAPLTVPNNELFVMGDNRNQSRDSRFFGTIPEGDVVGRAFVTVWPPSRWTGL